MPEANGNRHNSSAIASPKNVITADQTTKPKSSSLLLFLQVIATDGDAQKHCIHFDQQHHPELNALTPINASIFFIPMSRCGMIDLKNSFNS